MKILILESDMSFAGEVKERLAGSGYDAVVSDDPDAGLGAAAAGGFDAIVVCVELAKMSGFAVCNKLRNQTMRRQVPIVLTSTDATEATFEQHQRLRTRADDYVHKPVSPDELVARIRRLPGQGSVAGAAQTRADELVSDNAAQKTRTSTASPLDPPVGASVLIAWSDGNRYAATLVRTENDQCVCRLADGREVTVPESQVTAATPP